MKGNTSLTKLDVYGDELKMYYNNGELCFEIDNYNISNVFYILKSNELYKSIKNLFQQIKHYDTFYYIASTSQGKKFEWISDGIGVPEAQNRLVIYENHDMFKFQFIKSKYNLNNGKNNCVVSFSSVRSNNDMITKLFNNLYEDVYNKTLSPKVKELTLTK